MLYFFLLYLKIGNIQTVTLFGKDPHCRISQVPQKTPKWPAVQTCYPVKKNRIG